MSFLSPLMLIGVLAGALPVAIHLIGRRRAPRVPFAAIDFVLRSDRRLARRLLVRQWLLLALRVALVAGIAVMMAKPFFETASDLPAIAAGQKSVVLVVDNSMSMRWRGGDGRTSFELAVERAEQLVSLFAAQADVAVITLVDPSGPLPQLSRDLRKVRAALQRIRPGFRHATADAALTQAGLILRTSALNARHIFLISDLARHGGPLAGWRPPDGVALHRVAIHPLAARNNRAVVELGAQTSTAPGQRSTVIVARVCNYGARAARVPMRLAIDRKVVARGLITLQAYACGKKRFQHSFSRGGVHDAEVAIEADALPADDRRFLRLEVRNDIRALVVNGQPSAIRHRDELFYLEAALSAGGKGQPIVVETLAASEIERARFDANDVVLLCNVGYLPPKPAQALAAFVKGGGGLFISAGAQVKPRRFNRSLGALLPQPARGAATPTRLSGGARALKIGRVAAEHPLIASFWSGAGGGGLRSARFFQVLRLRPLPSANRRVVIAYDDGSPALIERQIGAGRVLLFTSTVDRDWTDLPIRPGYLPLMQQIVRYLSRAVQDDPHPQVTVGQRGVVSLVRAPRRVRLTAPGGVERIFGADQLKAGRLEIAADRPGIYTLRATAADGVERPLQRQSFAANIDPRESDLRGGKGGAKPSPGAEAVGAVARAKRKVELWHGLGAALLLLLLVESFLTRRG